MDNVHIENLHRKVIRYGIKKLAREMNKSESTLRNELTQQPGFKLGYADGMRILQILRN